MNRM